MTTDRAGPEGTIETVETTTFPSGATLTVCKGPWGRMAIFSLPYHGGHVFDRFLGDVEAPAKPVGCLTVPPESPH